jgi:hypothetical protein
MSIDQGVAQEVVIDIEGIAAGPEAMIDIEEIAGDPDQGQNK